jgi:Leucine-rich repeat (LRR) protein
LTATLCGAIGCNLESGPTGGGSSGGAPVSSENAGPPTLPAGALAADAPNDAIHAALRAKNPDYQNDAQVAYLGDEVAQLVLAGTKVTDLSPLRGLRLQVLDVSDTQVADLAPIAGMPLKQLFIEGTNVADLSPLAGMRLEQIYLGRTKVTSLEGLRGAPLTMVNLVQTQVRDLSPLRGAPLRSVWLNGTPVSDLSPLAGSPIQSLTIAGTQVADIAPVRNMPSLERLHLADTPVTDLSPVDGLRLTRLVFTPSRITKGLEAARRLPACQEIGTRFDDSGNNLMPPAQFWPALEAGAIP